MLAQTPAKEVRKQILFVDENTYTLKKISEHLSGLYDVETLSSAQECLKLLFAQQLTLDLIILDMWINGFDGMELAKKIQRIPHYKDTPIIFFSYYIERAPEAQSRGNLFLPKMSLREFKNDLQYFFAYQSNV